jgi:hypothetical protein
MTYNNTQWHEALGNEVSAREIVNLAGTVSPLNLAQWLQDEFSDMYPDDAIPTVADFLRWAVDIVAESAAQDDFAWLEQDAENRRNREMVRGR